MHAQTSPSTRVAIAPATMTRADNQDFYEVLAVLYDQPDHVRLASQFADHVLGEIESG